MFLLVDRKLSATASIKQLTAPLHETNVRYDAYRGDLVEPFKCKNCVDVFVMKERFTVSVNQVIARHCSLFEKRGGLGGKCSCV